MVQDIEMQDIVIHAGSPQSACDGLIQAASLAGGEDNISAIVIRME